jgi:hypothetical protein
MRNERPEFDEGGRKRIKRRKLGLKDTGAQLVDYNDSWTAIEDVIFVLVMDSGTYKYYDSPKRKRRSEPLLSSSRVLSTSA